MRIYTRTGDKGQTSLFNGSRVDKSSERIDLLGEIDDLNAHIGLLISYLKTDFDKSLLQIIQNVLFDGGSEIANPGIIEFTDYSEDIDKLEKNMDELDKDLADLHNFILPGGSKSSSYSHLCRTKTRRVERLFFRISKENTLNDSFGKFLNRLSDYFFVLARYLNKESGKTDIIWIGKRTN